MAMSNHVADIRISKEGRTQETRPSALPSCTIANTSIPIGSASLPVPSHVRQFVLSNYPVEQSSSMFFHADEPQRIYVLQNNSLQYVDLCCICPPFESTVIPLSTRSGEQPGLVSPLCSMNCAADAVLSSGRTSQICSSEWQAMSDIERGVVQKDCLNLAYAPNYLERRKTNAYKTALCRQFRDTGRCGYGATCRFAHGEGELRLPPQAHPKYKTQLCNKFALLGRCPYGAHCQFIHRRPNEPVSGMSADGKRGEKKVVTTKSIDIQVPCGSLAVQQNQRRGAAAQIDTLGKMFHNWLLDDVECAFSQSCFPRIDSASS